MSEYIYFTKEENKKPKEKQAPLRTERPTNQQVNDDE